MSTLVIASGSLAFLIAAVCAVMLVSRHRGHSWSEVALRALGAVLVVRAFVFAFFDGAWRSGIRFEPGAVSEAMLVVVPGASVMVLVLAGFAAFSSKRPILVTAFGVHAALVLASQLLPLVELSSNAQWTFVLPFFSIGQIAALGLWGVASSRSRIAWVGTGIAGLAWAIVRVLERVADAGSFSDALPLWAQAFGATMAIVVGLLLLLSPSADEDVEPTTGLVLAAQRSAIALASVFGVGILQVGFVVTAGPGPHTDPIHWMLSYGNLGLTVILAAVYGFSLRGIGRFSAKAAPAAILAGGFALGNLCVALPISISTLGPEPIIPDVSTVWALLFLTLASLTAGGFAALSVERAAVALGDVRNARNAKISALCLFAVAGQQALVIGAAMSGAELAGAKTLMLIFVLASGIAALVAAVTWIMALIGFARALGQARLDIACPDPAQACAADDSAPEAWDF